MAPCRSRAAPWWGMGRSPMPLPLTFRAAPLSSKERQRSAPNAQVRQRHQSSRSELFRAAHTPQHIARFRKPGKRRFPDFRREADALYRRWEAKRSHTLPLTRKTGANGKVKGLTVSGFPTVSGILQLSSGPPRFYRRPAALCELGAHRAPNSTDSRDWHLWRRSGFLVRTLGGRLMLCLVPFSVSAALTVKGQTSGALPPNPCKGPCAP